MPREADFNFSDEELEDEEGAEGEEGQQHAGDDGDDDGDGAEAPDRGDNVGEEGVEGDPDAEAGEEEAEEEEAEEEGADPEFLQSLAGGGKTPQHVPYARLAEVVAQNQQLMQVLEGITSGRLTPAAAAAAKEEEAAPAFDMKAQIKARNAALLEGDEDKAAEIDLAIEEYRTTTIRQQARQEAMQDFTAAQQKQALDNIVTEAFGKYTFLNDQSEDFNAEALDEVMMYRNHYVTKGDALPVALAKAIDKVCPQYVDGDDDGDAAAAAAAAKAKPAGGKVARDPAKVVRNAKAAKAQPPETGKAGTANRETIDVSKLNLETMDDDKYDALPASVKAQLRGDAVA